MLWLSIVVVVLQHLSHAALVMPQNQDVEVFLYPKLPYVIAHNASVAVYQGDFPCTLNAFPSTNNHTEDTVFVIIGETHCYPSQLGELAMQAGFSGVIVVYDSSYFELSIVNYWNRQGHGVSVYRSREYGIDWTNVERIWLENSELQNYLDVPLYLVEIVLVGILLGVLAFYKLICSISRLTSYWRFGLSLNHGMVILLVEILASLITLVYLIDPYGIRGVYSWGVVSLLLRMYLGSSLITTCIAWDGMVQVQLKVGLIKSTICTLILRIVCIIAGFAFQCLTIATIIYNFLQGAQSYVIAMESLTSTLLSAFFSYSFLKNKKRVYTFLADGASLRSKFNTQKMAHYLALSAIFLIFGILMSFIVVLSSGYIMSSLIVWNVLSGYIMCQSIVGIFQVFSVPYNEKRSATFGQHKNLQSDKIEVI